MEVPETIILACFTHGMIILDNKDEPYPYMYEIPKNVEDFTKLSSVTCGVSNYYNEDDSSYYFDLIKHSLDKKVTENPMEVLIDQFKQHQHEKEKGLQQQITEAKNIPEMQSAIRKLEENLNKAASSFVIVPHTPSTINKLFLRYMTDKEQIANKKKKYDGKIIIMNMEGNPDIITLIKGEDARQIYLNEIIGWLSTNNVKRIILFDFSCSDFYKIGERGPQPIDARAVRALRNRLQRDGLRGGKLIKKRTKKNYKRYSKRCSTKYYKRYSKKHSNR